MYFFSSSVWRVQFTLYVNVNVEFNRSIDNIGKEKKKQQQHALRNMVCLSKKHAANF